MKNLSKVMAVVLAMLMTLSTVSFAAFSDVPADASYGEAVSILNALGILKGDAEGTFRPDDTIKRSEFAAVVCRILGLGDAGEGAKGQVVFNDVSGEHWASGYIALASQQGIVNGKGDGIFDPDAPVKYEEAVKMIVAALGYTPMADTNGGYPGGYQIVAAQKGILSGVKGIQGDAASRSLVAQMCYNALEVPLMVQDGFGTEISYGYGDQLLLNKLGVTKFEGSVYATSASDDKIKEGEVELKYEVQVTAIEGQSTASRYKTISGSALNDKLYDCNPVAVMDAQAHNKVLIDDADETLADTVASLLDYSVVMYVKDADTDDATLVAIAKKGSRNKTVEFKTEDINMNTGKTVLTGTDKKVAVYTEDDDYETYDLAVEKIYINGRQTSVEDACGVSAGTKITTDTDIENVLTYYFKDTVAADVTLLCGQSTSDEYNVVYITAYKDYVVDTISAKSYSITSKANDKVIFDEENDDYRFTIVKDGAKITFADIQVNDVISIAGYINNKELEYGTAIVTSQQVAGVVKTYDPDEATITIDDATYDYDKSKIIIGSDIRLGDTVTMYLNARNVLVGVDKSQSKTNLKYGFATIVYKSTGIDNAFQLRLMDTEGTWKTVNFADKVAFNDAAAVTVTNDAISAWTTRIGKVGLSTTDDSAVIEGNKALVNKVVGYETNSEGKINKIYFQNDATPSAEDIYYTKVITTPQYNESTEDLGGVFLNDNSILFSVAGSITNTAAVAEDNVSVAKKDALVDRDEYKDTMVINLDDDNYAAAAMGIDLVGSINKAAAFFTISAISTTTNDEGDEGKLLTGIRAGEEEQIFVNNTETAVVKADYTLKDSNGASIFTEGTTAATLAKGDVIIFSKAANGDAKKVVVLLDASDYVDTAALKNGNATTEMVKFEAGGTDYRYIIGFVSSVASKRVGIMASTPATDATVAKDTEELLSFKTGATMAYYDAFYKAGSKTGEADIADSGDIDFMEFDANDKVTGLGDIIFARAVNETTIEDVVIIKQYSSR